MSDLPQLDRFVRDATRFALRAYRQARQWLEQTLADAGVLEPKSPAILWVDRSPGVVAGKHGRAGRVDPVTGMTIETGDRVCVCSSCDSTFLASTWEEIQRSGSSACPICHARRSIHPL